MIEVAENTYVLQFVYAQYLIQLGKAWSYSVSFDGLMFVCSEDQYLTKEAAEEAAKVHYIGYLQSQIEATSTSLHCRPEGVRKGFSESSTEAC
jgi:hypothetical protein